jgi:hypothetical protein
MVNEGLIRNRRSARAEMQESPCFQAQLTSAGDDEGPLRKRFLTEMARI